MKTIKDLRVGDTAYWTDVNRKGIHTGTVTKVGRLLITAGGYVFRMDTGRTNDGYSHQTLIADLEAFKDWQMACRVFSVIQRSRIPRDISSADVIAAAKLLRINIEEQP